MSTKAPSLALLATLAALAACGGDDDSASKAGGTGGGPVTLRIGTDDVPGKPASLQIEEFARRVATLSGGDIKIKPVWHAAGDDGLDWDQQVGRMVTSGELDMGNIPARSWDTEGVTTLRALNAPFLIDSDELTNEVVSSDLAEDLMAGLEKAKVKGLALLPEGMRHPFGLPKPLHGPDDYAGKTIRTPVSETVEAMYKALGADVDAHDPNASKHAAVENEYVAEPIGAATGNVTFFPKVNSLVINADRLAGLDDGQRDILEQAAEQTMAWVVEENPTDAEAAKEFCAGGRNRIVAADEKDVAALREATAPVVADLERDGETKRIIEAIRAMKEEVGVSAHSATSCGGEGTDAGGDEPPDESVINGVYRFELTDKELRERGVTDPNDIAENHGILTYTFKDGEWCFEQKAPNAVANPDDCSTYELIGDRLIYSYPEGDTEEFTWKKVNGGDLTFKAIRVNPAEEQLVEAFIGEPWIRIGDPD